MADGAAKLVVDALKQFPADGGLQEACLHALQTLCAAPEARAAELGELGLPDLVVAVTAAHTDVEELQRTACGLFCTLASSEGAEDALAACGAVQAVLRAMRTFPGSVPLQVEALSALANMCTAESARSVALQEGIVEVVVATLD